MISQQLQQDLVERYRKIDPTFLFQQMDAKTCNLPEKEFEQFRLRGRFSWINNRNIVYPYHARSLLKCEIVLDVDPKDRSNPNAWSNCYADICKVLDTLKMLKVPYTLTFSGTLVHIHIYFSPKTTIPFDIFKEYIQIIAVDGKASVKTLHSLSHQLKTGLFNYIIDTIPKLKTCEIDREIITAEGKGHLVREICSKSYRNGQYKTWLSYLPEQPPNIDKPCLVQIPPEISFWDIENGVLYEVWNQIKPKLKKTIIKSDLQSKGTIKWVEELHQKPLSDFRKRLIGLVFSPYATNVLELSDERAFVWIKQWTDQCQSKYDLDQISDFFIRSNVSFARSRGYKVARWSKVKNMLLGEGA